MFINTSVYDNLQRSAAILQTVNGTVVPLKNTELTGEIVGLLFMFELIQTFGYEKEACDKVIEAVYRFPLPGDAAVTSACVHFGDTEITAILKERGAAEKDYQEAKRAGRQATLMTKESPDVFTLNIAGIKPEQEVVVRTFGIIACESTPTGFKLQFPLTVAPRFVRTDETYNGTPLAISQNPGHSFLVDISLFDVAEVNSFTHLLDIKTEGNETTIGLLSDNEIPNKDFVLEWEPVKKADISYIHDDDEYRYFLTLLQMQNRPRISKEVTILLDHSGSMNGEKRTAADKAAIKILKELAKEDTFNVCIFDGKTNWFRRIHTNISAVPDAVQFIVNDTSNGGTELGKALEEALLKPKSKSLDQSIVVLTDGQVSDYSRILALASQQNGKNGRRIHVVCIDSTPNVFLAREIAKRSGGTSTFLSSGLDMKTFLEVLNNVVEKITCSAVDFITLQGDTLESADKPFTIDGEKSYVTIGAVSSQPVWTCGRIKKTAGDIFVLDKENAKVSTLSFDKQQDFPAIKLLFGAARLIELETLREPSLDRDYILAKLKGLRYNVEYLGQKTIYQENMDKQLTEFLINSLITESLYYGLICSQTGFVAVRKEKGKLVEETKTVSNALPHGWENKGMLMQSQPSNWGSTLNCSITEGTSDWVSKDLAGYSANCSIPIVLAKNGHTDSVSNGCSNCCSNGYSEGYGSSCGRSESQGINHVINRPCGTTVSQNMNLVYCGIPYFNNHQAVLYEHVISKKCWNLILIAEKPWDANDKVFVYFNNMLLGEFWAGEAIPLDIKEDGVLRLVLQKQDIAEIKVFLR